MEWTDRHDTYLCREMLAVGIMKTKKKTVNRAQMWETIAQNLCAYDEPKFVVTKRAVRDRYGKISEKYCKRMSSEENATGISPEQSELDLVLEELIERENLADEETAENKRKAEEEKVKCTEVRKQAMERLADTKRRNEVANDEEKTPKKRRRSGSAAIDFLRSQCEQETQLKQMEMQSRKEEQEAERVRNENAQSRHDSLMQMLIQQQQQQQQQTANFQALISQQNQAMLTLMAQLAKK